jgi:hypothetical protein
MSMEKFMNAGIHLKIEKKAHPLIQGHASHGLEGPQPRQTDITSAPSSTRGVRAHQAVAQPKMRPDGVSLRSAVPMVRPNQVELHHISPSTWCLHNSSQGWLQEAHAILPAERRCATPINIRGVLLNEPTKT